MIGYVYLTTNSINDKKYTGMHRKNYFDENYKGSGKILRYAINKYGWENFKTEVLGLKRSMNSLLVVQTSEREV